MAYNSSIALLKATQNGFEASIAVAGAFPFLFIKFISMPPPASSPHRAIYIQMKKQNKIKPNERIRFNFVRFRSLFYRIHLNPHHSQIAYRKSHSNSAAQHWVVNRPRALLSSPSSHHQWSAQDYFPICPIRFSGSS